MKEKRNSTSGYTRPPWIMRHVFDPLTVILVGRLGMDDHNGTRVLNVPGRKSGKWRATPVRVLDLEGQQYLVAMYGESGWVRNLRASGNGHLRLGHEIMEFHAVELSGEEKLPVFRAYLRRWWSLVGPMSGLTSADAPDEEVRRVAEGHPVFRLG